MYIEQMAVKEKQAPAKTYSFEEAYKAALEYFKGDELAAKVWASKYALKDSAGNIYEKTPDDMHRRIAKEIHRIEQKYPNPLTFEQIYNLLKDFKYLIPAGSPMAGIGNPYQIASLSNCFVIGETNPADSYGGIMKTDQEQVQLMKRRGGVGHDLSHIRPAGSPVLNSALTSTGIVPFMERYSNSTREVAQDGRRGALMLTVSIKHPDAEHFIDAKTEQNKVTGANVSVKIDDEFMEAVQKGTTYRQQFPVDAANPTIVKEIDARKLWRKIVHNAWKSAEPGILFWDTIINESVADSYADEGFRTMATNPCGEIPLCPYDSCRLLAINLYSYVQKPFTKEARFDFDLLNEHVAYAQRIMDDIIDLELEKVDKILEKIDSDPEDKEVKRVERLLWEKIKEKAIQGRRTGIGITAEGDMLAALGLRYGSENAINFSEEVHKTIALTTYKASMNLALDRGAFPIWNFAKEHRNPFLQRLFKQDTELEKSLMRCGRRNISLLTIAPTGSSSLMTQTSSGIEPVFMPYYKRRRKVNPSDKDVKVTFVDKSGDSWEEYNVFHHKFIDWYDKNWYKFSSLWFDLNYKPELEDLPEDTLNKLVAKSPYHKATANDVDWLAKVRMQGRIQKWIDHSISVTINLPKEATEELVEKLYIEAWKSGCKGVTVYRDGSRDGVLISSDEKKGKTGKRKKRPYALDAEVIRFTNNKEKWIAFLGLRDSKPYEIFTGMDEPDVLPVPKSINRGKIIKNKLPDGSKRYDFQYTNRLGYHVTIEGLSYKFNPEFWNYAKLISGVLRQEMPIVNVVNLISSLHLNNETINTWKNGVERALRKYIPNGTKPKNGAKCSSCGSDALIYQEGCLICQSCGASKCG